MLKFDWFIVAFGLVFTVYETEFLEAAAVSEKTLVSFKLFK